MNDISGELPLSIYSLENLIQLNLQGCDFNGDMQPSIASLSNLELLRIGGNSFNTPLPIEIGMLSNLWTLYINEIPFNSAMPQWIGQLSNLSELYASNCNFNGEIPSYVSDLRSIRLLYLGRNNFVGELPDLSPLTSLRLFNVELNDITGSLSDKFSTSLTELTQFDVLGNEFIDLPAFTSFSNPENIKVKAQANFLSFQAIESNLNPDGTIPLHSFIYSPQNSPTDPVEVTTGEGTPILNDRSGGAHTQYQWQEWNGSAWVNLTGVTTEHLQLTGLDNTYIGNQYRCEMTNTLVTGLTIYSSEFVVTAVVDPIASDFVPGALYNGNITSMQWRTTAPVDTDAQDFEGVYLFDYDEKYQLKEAVFGESDAGAVTISTNNYRLNTLTYDANGNIQTLRRYDNQGGIKHDFGYDYAPNTNQLDKIDGHATYHYNNIGQLTGEINENGQEKYVDYDVTGKVVAVYADAAKSNPKVTYKYDDRGFRLMSRNEDTGTETWYIRDASGNVISIYEKKDAVGDLVQKEVPVYGSGKIGTYYADQDGSVAYEMTDHLGNVRAVVSRRRVTFEATMEDTGQPDLSNPRVEEMQYFMNLDGTEYTNAGALNNTLGGSISAFLDGNTGKIIGPAITLVAKAGNTYKMEVFGKYEEQGSYASPVGVADLASALGQTYLNLNGQEVLSTLTGTFNTALTGFANNGANTALPLAFLNVIHFDHAFNVVQAEKVQLTTAAGFVAGQEHLTDFDRIHQEIEIASDQDGYVYVYVSNHTPASKVYFDDLSVTLEEDIVTQATDYYPFGSVARRANTPNSYFEDPNQTGVSDNPSLTESLVAGYTLNNTLDDLVVNGGSFTTDKDGNVNSAYELNGASNFLQIADNSSLDFGSDDFAVSFWVKKRESTAAGGSYSNLGGVGKWNNGGQVGTNEWNLSIGSGSNTDIPVFGVESGSDKFKVTSGVPLVINDWSHVLGMRKNGDISIHVNGVLQESLPIGDITLNNVGLPVYIGRIGSGNYSDAVFDDIFIFNRALTQTEIQQLAQKQTPQEIDAANNDILVDDLVAQYYFDGNADDESGNGLNGTVSGATLATDRNGNANSAYSFDGQNDYINLGNGQALDLVDNFTVSVWVKPNTLDQGGGWTHLFGKPSIDINNRPLYLEWVDASKKLRFTWRKDGTYGALDLTETITDLDWQHCVITMENGTAKTYLNGQMVGTFTGVLPPSSSSETYIGTKLDGKFWKGKIDDLTIFNAVLTPQQIAQLASGQTPQEIDAANSAQLTANSSFGQYYRYGFQGEYSEEDSETGWNSFELRMYDPVIGRWLTPDPFKQFNSPFVYANNNSVNLVDPDGGYAGPDDIIIRSKSSGKTLLIIQSNVLDAKVEIEDKAIINMLEAMGPVDVVTNKKDPLKYDLRHMDNQLKFLNNDGTGSGDANLYSLGIDATALTGISFSLDIVHFNVGDYENQTFLYWTKAIGGGWMQGVDFSEGILTFRGDNISNFIPSLIEGEGRILNIGGGPYAFSALNNLEDTYRGRLFGVGVGVPGAAAYKTTTTLITELKIRDR
ncbi:MAG: LamG-like jellyroll fold domain-containing protein [Bacteroidota bacterium]